MWTRSVCLVGAFWLHLLCVCLKWHNISKCFQSINIFKCLTLNNQMVFTEIYFSIFLFVKSSGVFFLYQSTTQKIGQREKHSKWSQSESQIRERNLLVPILSIAFCLYYQRKPFSGENIGEYCDKDIIFCICLFLCFPSFSSVPLSLWDLYYFEHCYLCP